EKLDHGFLVASILYLRTPITVPSLHYSEVIRPKGELPIGKLKLRNTICALYTFLAKRCNWQTVCLDYQHTRCVLLLLRKTNRKRRRDCTFWATRKGQMETER